MANRQPDVHGEPEQAQRGIEPVRPGVDLDGDPALGAGGEDPLGVELRLRPRLARCGSAPYRPRRNARSTTYRPVQWPRMSRCGFAIAVSIRRVIASRRHPQLRCARSDDDVERRQQLVGSWSSEPSARTSTSMPVSRRKPVGQRGVDRGHDVELLGAAAPAVSPWQRSAGASGRSGPGTSGRARPRRAPSPRSVSRRRTSPSAGAVAPQGRAQLTAAIVDRSAPPVASRRPGTPAPRRPRDCSTTAAVRVADALDVAQAAGRGRAGRRPRWAAPRARRPPSGRP